jgi:hypothetical protein
MHGIFDSLFRTLILLVALSGVLLHLGCGNVNSSIESKEVSLAFSASPSFKFIFINQTAEFKIVGGAKPYTVRKLIGNGMFSLDEDLLTYTATSNQEVAQVEITDSTQSKIYLSVQVTDPGAPAILSILSGAPGAFTNISKLNISVSGQGVVGYKYLIISAAQSCDDGQSYSSLRLVNQSIEDDLVLEQNYKVCVVGVNMEGIEQLKALATEVTFLRDVTPPTEPVVISDGSSSRSLTESATYLFQTGTDSGSGVERVEGRILRVSDSAVLTAWAPIETSGAIGGLGLGVGLQYKTLFRTVDKAGNTSGQVEGDGWTAVDAIAPVVKILRPLNKFVVNAPLQEAFKIEGTCSAIGRGVEISVNGVSSGSSTCSTNGKFFKTLDLSSLANGLVTISAQTSNSEGEISNLAAAVGKKNSADTGLATFNAVAGGNNGYSNYCLLRDSAGDYFEVSHFLNDNLNSTGIVDFSNNTLLGVSASIGNNALISKMNSSGAVLWRRVMNSAEAYNIRSCALDQNGDLIYMGYFANDSANTNSLSNPDNSPFLGLRSSLGHDMFVAKISSSGVHQWSRKAGSSGSAALELASEIVVDKDNNILLAMNQGYTGGSEDFDFAGQVLSFPGVANNNGDSFIYKLDTDGNQLWVRRLGGASSQDGYLGGLDTDSEANVYILTNFFNSAVNSYGAKDFSSQNILGFFGGLNSHIVLAKLDKDGTQQWTKRAGGSITPALAGAVTVDGNDNLYVLYSAQPGGDSKDLGGQSIPLRVGTSNDGDLVLERFDSNGVQSWSKTFGGISQDQIGEFFPPPFFVDMQGYLYFGSTFINNSANSSNVLDFAGASLPGYGASDSKDAMIIKFDSYTGQQQWIITAGGAGDDGVRGLISDGTGKLIVSGNFMNNLANQGGFVDFWGNTVLGKGTIAYTQGYLFSFTPTDICEGTPAIGSTCLSGTQYAGTFDGGKYMVTPPGCEDANEPSCNGSSDTLLKTWNNGTNTPYLIPGVEGFDFLSQKSSSDYRGNINTPIVAALTSGNPGGPYPAAKYCEDLIFGGYSDWYLPSKSELAYLYCKSTPGTAHNPAFPNEEPDCISYGGKESLLGGFANGEYWASTQLNSGGGFAAWTNNFSNGQQYGRFRSSTNYVRCVRRY